MKYPWLILGHGRVGRALEALAARLAAPVLTTWNRTPGAASLSGPLPGSLRPALSSHGGPLLVFITVADDAIAQVFATVAPSLPRGSLVVHTSGSHASTLLRDVAVDQDHLFVASLHPLLAITDPDDALRRFPETFWTLEGDPEATEHLRALLAPAGIHPRAVKNDGKVLYHASAVTAANLLVSLFDAALEIAAAAGLERDEARSALVTLARSSLENLERMPPRDALTGPVARGDLHTIDRHREALASLDDPELLAIYELLTGRALRRLKKE